VSDERIILVEGNDDVHAIVHVLKKRGLFIEGYMKLHDSGGWDNLISAVPVRLKSAAHRVIGIVADADNCLDARWSDICKAVRKFGFNELPAAAPKTGYVAQNDAGVRVGIWLMPNNLDNGALEDFLLTLVDPSDKVFLKAKSIVCSLSADEKRFSKVAERKAISHTYLAWQETPGRPLGLSVNFNYFNARADAAQAFQDWYSTLMA
jgi:hypothetical protein